MFCLWNLYFLKSRKLNMEFHKFLMDEISLSELCMNFSSTETEISQFYYFYHKFTVKHFSQCFSGSLTSDNPSDATTQKAIIMRAAAEIKHLFSQAECYFSQQGIELWM